MSIPDEPLFPKPYTELDDERYEDVLAALADKPQRLRGLLAPLHPADIADVIERLPLKQRAQLITHVSEDVLGDVLSELEETAREHLLKTLQPQEVADILEELESDDAVDLAHSLEEALPTTLDQEAPDGLDAQEKRLFRYERDTAGGMMQLEVVTAMPTQKVSDMLKFLRTNHADMPDKPGTIFVVNERRKLLGTVSLSRLVKCPLNSTLESIMRLQPLVVEPEDTRADVISMFEKYDIHNLAVVNNKGQLLGRIAIDDVLDAIMSEHEREVRRLGGLDEKDDLFSPAKDTTRKRLPWLIINLFTAILASSVVAMFEGTIEKLVTLAVLMPIVASMGGNAGTQTLTVMVRGLATGQITKQNAMALLSKELTVGSLNGLVLSVMLGIGTFAVYGDWRLGLTIVLATIANHLFAAAAGHVIPMFLKKMGYDPAITSGVFVTTVTDVGGFFTFLGLATLLLL
ncbi:MAG: magnesium transporter [Alphaproteobacteria bacterium]